MKSKKSTTFLLSLSTLALIAGACAGKSSGSKDPPPAPNAIGLREMGPAPSGSIPVTQLGHKIWLLPQGSQSAKSINEPVFYYPAHQGGASNITVSAIANLGDFLVECKNRECSIAYTQLTKAHQRNMEKFPLLPGRLLR